MVEFQSVDTVFHPVQIGRNPRTVTALPARKVDLSGRIALHIGKGNVATTPGEAVDFVEGAALSQGGLAIFALPSRNLKGEPNIRLSVEQFPNLFGLRESVDMIATEYGVANLKGRTVRERAQALIEIAHPDDRASLFEQAKANNIIYADQIFLSESARPSPAAVDMRCTFKGGISVHFRAIKPSDEEEMRRLFYRFSDEAVYYRYFAPIKVMPHRQMQSYVNVDPSRVCSVVGLVGAPGEELIIAEARFVISKERPYGDVAFVVDEQYQGVGIASKLFSILAQQARERKLFGFTADVLPSNKAMLKVLEKSGVPMRSTLKEGAFQVTMTFKT